MAAANDEVACAEGIESELGAPPSGGRPSRTGRRRRTSELDDEVDADRGRGERGRRSQRPRRRRVEAAAASPAAAQIAPYSPLAASAFAARSTRASGRGSASAAAGARSRVRASAAQDRRPARRCEMRTRGRSWRPTSAASASAGLRCSSRTSRRRPTSSTARCRCSASSSSASCSGRSTSTGRRWRTSPPSLGGLAILLVGDRASQPRPRATVPRGPADASGCPSWPASSSLPALLPLIFGGQWRSALVTAAANLLLLLLISGWSGSACVSILRWVLGRLLSQLRASLDLLAGRCRCCSSSRCCSSRRPSWEIFSESPTVYGRSCSASSSRSARHSSSSACRGGDGRWSATPAAGPAAAPAPAGSTSAWCCSSARRSRCCSSASRSAPSSSSSGCSTVDAEILQSWIGTAATSWSTSTCSASAAADRGAAAGVGRDRRLHRALLRDLDADRRRLPAEFLDELTAEMRETFRQRAEYLRLRAAHSGAGAVENRRVTRPRRARRWCPATGTCPGNHCGSTALRNLLGFHGVEISRGDGLRARRRRLLLLLHPRRPVAVAVHQRPRRAAGGELPSS